MQKRINTEIKLQKQRTSQEETSKSNCIKKLSHTIVGGCLTLLIIVFKIFFT